MNDEQARLPHFGFLKAKAKVDYIYMFKYAHQRLHDQIDIIT